MKDPNSLGTSGDKTPELDAEALESLNALRVTLQALPDGFVKQMETARGFDLPDIPDTPVASAGLGAATALPGLGALPSVVGRLGEIAEQLEGMASRGGERDRPAASSQQPARIDLPDPRDSFRDLHQAAASAAGSMGQDLNLAARPAWAASAGPDAAASIPPALPDTSRAETKEREEDDLTELVRDMDQRFRPEWTERTEESPSAALLMPASAEAAGASLRGGAQQAEAAASERPAWAHQPADSAAMPSMAAARGLTGDVERPAWTQHGTAFSSADGIGGTPRASSGEPFLSSTGAEALTGAGGAAEALGGATDVGGILEKLTGAVEKLTDAIESSGRGAGVSGGRTFGGDSSGPLQRVGSPAHTPDLEADEGYPQASPSVNVSVIPGSGGAGGYGLGSRRPAPAPLIGGGRGKAGPTKSRSGFTEAGQRPGGGT